MDETIEKIVADALRAVDDFTYSDQYELLSEVARRLQEAADTALKTEYMLDGMM